MDLNLFNFLYIFFIHYSFLKAGISVRLFEHVCPFVNAVMNVYDMVDEVIALVKHI
jgi:hypothetical protein